MSLNKKLFAGGAAAGYMGGEFNYTASSSGVSVDVGHAADLAFLFPANSGNSIKKTYVLDKSFPNDRTFSVVSDNDYRVANTNVVTWSDTGFTVNNSGSSSSDTPSHMLSGTDNWTGMAFKTSDTGVSNTDGTRTSTVYANPDAGISKVIFTGGNNVTVGHGLGVTPELILILGVATGTYGSTTTGGNFARSGITCYHSTVGGWHYRSTNMFCGPDTTGGNMTANSSTFTTHSDSSSLGFDLSYTYHAYCFAKKSGFSDFENYVGNASTSTRTVLTADFNPTTIYILGDFSAHFLGISRRSSGTPGTGLIQWDSNDESIVDTRDLLPSAGIGTGEYYRADHRTNKRVLFNTDNSGTNGSSDKNSVIAFGGDSWYYPGI